MVYSHHAAVTEMVAHSGRFVSYLRVSTGRQGASGLGLEAQRASVNDFLNGGSWTLVGEFLEVESGRKSNRPELSRALAACRVHGATLVVAKLDRLVRNYDFLRRLEESGVNFVAADMPHANRLTVHILAAVAEEEARMISRRTRDALRAAQARGRKLGNPNNLTAAARREGSKVAATERTKTALQRARDLVPVVTEIRASGITSLRATARELDLRGIPTARGGAWSAVQVKDLLKRVGESDDR
jgi:DNA invertase Pin-like site-specific DNA recombinase